MSASVAPRIISKADGKSVSAKVDDRFVGRIRIAYSVRTTDTPRFRASRRLNLEMWSVWEFNLDESEKIRQCTYPLHHMNGFLQEVIFNRKGFKFIALIVWIKCPEMCGIVSKSCRESGELPFPMKRHFQGYHPLFPNSTFVASTSLLIVRAG